MQMSAQERPVIAQSRGQRSWNHPYRLVRTFAANISAYLNYFGFWYSAALRQSRHNFRVAAPRRTSFCSWSGGLTLQWQIIVEGKAGIKACLLLLNHSFPPHTAAEARYWKELQLHLNITFSLPGKCHLHVYLPPGADARPDVVYLLRGAPRFWRGWKEQTEAGRCCCHRPSPPPITCSFLLLLSPYLDSHSIHLLWPFPSNVAAVKRRRELVTDGGVEVITSHCPRRAPPILLAKKKKAEPKAITAVGLISERA